MDEPQPGADELQPGTEAQSGLAARRHMLKRSLGMAAPVAMTLASTPVSAGVCMNASSFVSVATFASRQPANALIDNGCSGGSPAYWIGQAIWPSPVNEAIPEMSRSGITFATALGGLPLTQPAGVKLLELLTNRPDSIEAHVAAVWLSASASPGLPPPFSSGDSVKAIWANIRANQGYRPLTGNALTLEGTMQWLAMTWQTPLP